MNYKGYTIIHSQIRGWVVIANRYEEYIATDERDAKSIVDKLIKRETSWKTKN